MTGKPARVERRAERQPDVPQADHADDGGVVGDLRLQVHEWLLFAANCIGRASKRKPNRRRRAVPHERPAVRTAPTSHPAPPFGKCKKRRCRTDRRAPAARRYRVLLPIGVDTLAFPRLIEMPT